MTQPVDLTNLRDMIGNDPDVEKELIDEFFSSFDSCLEQLRLHYAGDKDSWRTNAHAMKGLALNLGAEELGNLCKEAQNGMEAATSEKGKMLRGIEEEYGKVAQQLRG